VRCGVVELAVDGLGEAAGRSAGGVAGADQMPQATAWQVLVLGAGVVAVALGDGAEGEVEHGGEVCKPGMLTAGAGVGDGVGAGDRDAPAGPRVAGGGAGDVAGLAGVEQAVRAGLGWGGGPAEQRAGRDEEVDQRRYRGRG